MHDGEKIGWLFFVAGSVVFTVMGVVNRDWWTAIGGLLFVIGCGGMLVEAFHRTKA